MWGVVGERMLLRSVLTLSLPAGNICPAGHERVKKSRLWDCGHVSSRSGEGPAVSSYEHRNEPFSSVKGKGWFWAASNEGLCCAGLVG